MQANGVKHICTPPYHPSSNGLVERVVQTLKSELKNLTSGTLHGNQVIQIPFLLRFDGSQ